jgi:Na+-driven multidrug efflux pump
MLKFALPALGIYLSNPLLSNIDNAFVGKLVGTKGLAALSPATLCIDQMLYLFTFLSRATTGLVASAYGNTSNSTSAEGNVDAARDAAAAPLTVSLIAGVVLCLFYAVGTPSLLSSLSVHPSLRPSATSYIHWRGAISSFALAQSICLSVLMATRDVMTPLKIVGLASLLNIIGDALFCAWPLRMGVTGAAMATAAATVFSSLVMIKSLYTKGLLPKLRLPQRNEFMSLLSYTGPLLAVTLTRLGGLVAMQTSAMALGVQPLAAYQLCLNLLVFFLLFGEPLSQLSQTQLPPLLDRGDSETIRGNLKSVGVLAVITALGIGATTVSAIEFGSGLFTSDPAVQLLAKQAAPSVFLAVTASILSVAADGAMLASRDFGFLLTMGMGTFLPQLVLLKTRCDSLSFVFGTFTMRLGMYTVAALGRVLLGYGPLGRAVRPELAARRTNAKGIERKEKGRRFL